MPDIDYTPPHGVRSACQRGLDLAPEHGGPGLTEGAKSRARAMASGKAISPDTARRIKAFHARHTEEKTASPPSPGYVAHQLWGGEAGRAWAGKLVGQQDAVGKGNAGYGAAFSHARASGKDKTHAAVRRRANAWLKANGKSPIGKGVLDRWRSLSLDERTDQAELEAQGFDREEARALAMAGTSRRRKAVAKRDYPSAYVAAARAALPSGLHQQLHRKARGSSGGIASRRSRAGRQDDSKAAKLARIAELRREMQQLMGEVDKSGPTISEVAPAGTLPGVPGLVGPAQRKRRRAVDKAADTLIAAAFADPVAKRVAPTLDEAIIKAVDDDGWWSGPWASAGLSGQTPNPADEALDAQRLVNGMDTELARGATDLGEARVRASHKLSESMSAYDTMRPGGPAMARVRGLDLDLGSGQGRPPGYLGVDIYPFDFATVIHDLQLGIPFPPATGRTVRMVNALDAIVGEEGDAMPLMRAVQDFLGIGGRFIYEGTALGSRVDWSQLPGLQVRSDERSDPTEDGSVTQQLQAERIAVRLPSVYGADPRFLGQNEQAPGELAEAQANMGLSQPVGVAMANLVHKSFGVQIAKADAHQQVVYGTILSPEEVDSQGDVMSAEEIEATAHRFLTDARLVGKEHGDPMDGAQVVESYITPQAFTFTGGQHGPQTVPAGSWVMAVKVGDADEWQAVLDGDYTGFSVGGWGERAPA